MRPSVSATCIISSSNCTDLASAGLGLYARQNFVLGLYCLSAKMLMPCLHQLSPVFTHNSLDLIQPMRLETIFGRQCDWIQPELGLISICFGMDVWGFVALVAEEDKAITPDPQYCWHQQSLGSLFPTLYIREYNPPCA